MPLYEGLCVAAIGSSPALLSSMLSGEPARRLCLGDGDKHTQKHFGGLTAVFFIITGGSLETSDVLSLGSFLPVFTGPFLLCL